MQDLCQATLSVAALAGPQRPNMVGERSEQTIAKQPLHPAHPVFVGRLIIRARNRTQEIVVNWRRLLFGRNPQPPSKEIIPPHLSRLPRPKITNQATW